MKLIIFGATGGTGRELLTQALAQGHHVMSFVRNPAKLDDIAYAKSRNPHLDSRTANPVSRTAHPVSRIPYPET